MMFFTYCSWLKCLIVYILDFFVLLQVALKQVQVQASLSNAVNHYKILNPVFQAFFAGGKPIFMWMKTDLIVQWQWTYQSFTHCSSPVNKATKTVNFRNNYGKAKFYTIIELYQRIIFIKYPKNPLGAYPSSPPSANVSRVNGCLWSTLYHCT